MKIRHLLLLVLVFAFRGFATAQSLDPAMQAKVDAQVKIITTWAADPVIIDAVKAHNASVPAEQQSMNQEKWKELTVLDPFVRSFAKNAAGQLLKAKKTEVMTEAFLSDAQGLKVAFIAKTENWSHKGKAKHEVPMTGQNWQGPVEMKGNTGVQQLQIAVPVLDGGKPIGSLVVGLSFSKINQ